ncbi:MAG: hypothetical protein JSV12_07855 [Candidatus Bathyarchaeota archaeon]|nr:MAG: hypothetical protein JSV12_07855 [Candidatus Bathyarchaeota archaeon]
MSDWICLKCGYKWVDESKVEPRYCPTCGSGNIYVPKAVKVPKYHT